VKRVFYAALFSLFASHAAADVTSAWVAQLQLDGYEDISVSRTWLGRTRIEAERSEIYREIILNPSTGEVLRDYSRHEDGSFLLPLGFDVDWDDHDDDDDDDGDDENDGDGEDD